MDKKRFGTIGLSLAAFMTLAPWNAAHASLGAMTPTIAYDAGQMRAPIRKVAMPDHVRHELALPNGGSVKEYTNAQGQVFAVSWHGPGKPDLRNLLGPHFVQLQSAGTRPRGRSLHTGRAPAMVSHSDVKIQTGGHMGWFWGVAFLPALAPAGFDADDLQ